MRLSETAAEILLPAVFVHYMRFLQLLEISTLEHALMHIKLPYVSVLVVILLENVSHSVEES